MAALSPVALPPSLTVKKPFSEVEIKAPRTIANYSRYNGTRYDNAPYYEGVLASPCKRIAHRRRRREVQNIRLPIRLRLTAPRPPLRLILKGLRPPVRLRLTTPRPALKIRFLVNVVALNKTMWALIVAKKQAANPAPQARATSALAILASAEEITTSARAIAASRIAKATEKAPTSAAKAIAASALAIVASAQEIAASAQAIVVSEDATALAAAKPTIVAQSTQQPQFATLCPSTFFDTVMKVPISPLSLDHDTDGLRCHHIKNEDIKMEG